MNIGKSIRVAVAMRGITQGKLAEIAGIHPVNLSKMANGKAGLQGDNLQRVADAVGMKVSEFIQLGED